MFGNFKENFIKLFYGNGRHGLARACWLLAGASFVLYLSSAGVVFVYFMFFAITRPPTLDEQDCCFSASCACINFFATLLVAGVVLIFSLVFGIAGVILCLGGFVFSILELCKARNIAMSVTGLIANLIMATVWVLSVLYVIEFNVNL